MQKEPEIVGEWLREIVQEFELAESEMPAPDFLRGEYPAWVAKLAMELVATLFPTAKLSPSKPWTPGEVGAIAGHRLAQLRGIEDAPAEEIPKEWESIELDAETERRIEEWERDYDAAWEKTETAIEKALVAASKRPHHEAKAFFRAFAKAYSKKPSDLRMTNFQRSSTQVYLLLFVYWRTVETIPSVAELHRRLCKALSPALVGNQKRVEKMCQRLGLHLGEIGRPGKRKKSDKTE